MAVPFCFSDEELLNSGKRTGFITVREQKLS